MSTSALEWRSHAISNLGVSLDVVDGPAVKEGEGAEMHYLHQQQEAMYLGITIGKSMTLGWWRSNFGSRSLPFGPEVAITVCGRRGHRQEVLAPAADATGVYKDAEGKLGHIHADTPSQVHVAVHGTTAGGISFVAQWIVDAARRDALRGDEDRFFASIRCT